MAEVVSALSTFDDELSFGLAKSIVASLDIVPYVTLHPNVNGSLQLNTVDSTIYFSNSTCTTTDTGSTTFAGNVLTTCLVGTNKDICLENIQSYWIGQYMAKTAYGANDIGTLTDLVISETADKFQKELNKLIWQGSNSGAVSYRPGYEFSGSLTNLTYCDGFLQKAFELSATCVANISRTAITSSNAISIIDNAYSFANADMKSAPDGLRLFLSPDDFDRYLVALRTGNFYHGTLDFKNIKEIPHLGARNLMVTMANGLDGANSGTFLLTYKENMNLGTLTDKDWMQFNGIWNPFARKYQINPRLRIGTQFTFAERLVRSAG